MSANSPPTSPGYVSEPSSPLQERESSPVRRDPSSPIRLPTSSPESVYASSSSGSGSPPVKRKKYTFNEPEVPDASFYWKPAHEEQDDLSLLQANEMHEDENAVIICDDNRMEDPHEHSEISDYSSASQECSDYADSCSSSDLGSEVSEVSVMSSEYNSCLSSTWSEADSDSSNSDPRNLRKIYSDCNLSVDEGVLQILEVFVRHKLEKATVGDILKMMLKFLPEGNLMPKSQHLIFKYVEDLCPIPPERVHFYCQHCNFYLGEESKDCAICNSSSKIGKFFQFSLFHQIKSLFENYDLASIIDKYSTEREQYFSEDRFSDICDGFEYRRACVPGPYNLTLLGHTDGISVSESSNASFWPIEFLICEVPPALRCRFMIVSGVWLDNIHPNFNCYFKPFAEEFLKLYDTGVTWTHPGTKEEHTSYIVCPAFCADAPVRAEIQNILVHGGKFCCHNCEEKMVKLPAEAATVGQKKKRRRRVFKFHEEPSQLRTSERMETQGEASLQRRARNPGGKFQAEKGVKGRSVISKLPKCDRSTVVYPEYMHLIYGILKIFMPLWFSKEEPKYSLKKFQNEINTFLENIRVPDFVTRIPRSTEYWSKWKANEFRSFLLYYSLIIFHHHMEEKYFQHWVLFVSATFLLLQETVSQNDLTSADIMLKMFLRDFAKLYKADSFTYNLHNLSHLKLTVERWGPLWCNSAFAFESFNGTLAKCIHGSKNQGTELINTLKIGYGIHILKSRINSPAECSNAGVQLRNCDKKLTLNELEAKLLSNAGITTPCRFYKRALIGKECYTSIIYKRQKKRNNYTVCYIGSDGSKSFGDIKLFCQSTKGGPIFALLNKFSVEHIRQFSHEMSGMVVKHIIPIQETDHVETVLFQKILFKVIRVSNFVCLRPNKFEVNL